MVSFITGFRYRVSYRRLSLPLTNHRRYCPMKPEDRYVVIDVETAQSYDISSKLPLLRSSAGQSLLTRSSDASGPARP
jgi:hypothetical protein